MSVEFSVVGKRLPRPDVAVKATGAARYTTDVKLPGMLAAKVLRSPYAHARVLKLDKSAAMSLPGVVAVIGPEDVPRGPFEMDTFGLLWDSEGRVVKDREILTERARFVGDAIAAVAAVDEATAEEALRLIEVEYEVLPAVFDPLEAIKPGAPLVHDFAKNNIVKHLVYPFAIGDVEKGFQEADFVVEGTFHGSRQIACPSEPAACVASFDGDRLTIWSPGQNPYILRTLIAGLFNIPEGKIRWMTPLVGGGWGNGINPRAEPVCIALALKTGKPVKLAFTREEQSFATDTREACIQYGKMGVKKDGAIIALQTKLIAESGAYMADTASTTAVNMGYFLSLYRCPNLAGQADIVYTNTPVQGGMRGYGNPGAMFALEQLVDMAAEKIGMDPLEFRIKNHRRTGEATRVPSIPIENCPLDDLIAAGAQKIGWQEKRQGKKEGVKRRGVGMATMQHSAGAYPRLLDFCNASVELNEDGSANLTIGSCEMGQGIMGTLGQMAAEELGLDAGDVNVSTGDTDTGMFDVGTYASRTIYNLGKAVIAAAAEAKGRLLERAAKMLEAEPGELEVKGGRVYFRAAPDKGLSVAQVARDAIYNYRASASHISGRSSMEPKGTNPAAYEAVFAEVEVDTETGVVTLLKLVQVHDIGRAINPMTVEGQLEGAIVQGLGWTLTEGFAINMETGVLESDNFQSYKLPRSADVPETEVVLVEQPVPSGPYGAKSVGECGMVAIAPAITNAIYNATGVRVTELKVTPERILQALRAKQGM